MDDPRRRRRRARERLGPDQLVLDDGERIGTPAIRPIVGPQIPAHTSTCSHSTSPWSVRTPDPALADVESGDPHATLEGDAVRLGLRGERRRHAHAFRDPVGGHEVRAEDVVGIQDRDPPARLAGERSSVPRSRTRANPRRRQLLRPLRRGRDLDPANLVPGGPSSVASPRYSSTEYCARRHIVREPFVWKTSPARGRSTRRSRTAAPGRGRRRPRIPSSARWYAALAPTIPAPITTVSARSRIRAPTLPNGSSLRVCWYETRRPSCSDTITPCSTPWAYSLPGLNVCVRPIRKRPPDSWMWPCSPTSGW